MKANLLINLVAKKIWSLAALIIINNITMNTSAQIFVGS